MAIVISICQSSYKYLTGIYSYLTEWFYVFDKVVMLTYGCFTWLCLCWSLRGRTDSWLCYMHWSKKLHVFVRVVICICQSSHVHLDVSLDCVCVGLWGGGQTDGCPAHNAMKAIQARRPTTKMQYMWGLLQKIDIFWLRTALMPKNIIWLHSFMEFWAKDGNGLTCRIFVNSSTPPH